MSVVEDILFFCISMVSQACCVVIRTHFLCPRTVEERPVTIQQAEYDNSHELFDVS